MSVVLGVDIGGTTIKARLLDGHNETLGEWRLPTPVGDSSGRQTVETVTELLRRARSMAEVDAIGVVIPGIVDEAAGICIRSMNLGWAGLPIRDILSSRLDLPIAFGHDVRAGLLAELATGAARDQSGTVVFVAVGTGLASAIAINQVAVSGRGWAGEIGQIMIAEGPHAGRRVEEIASASGIARAAGLPDAQTVADRVRAGDEAAILVWNSAIEVLAEALAWTTAVIAPTVIVLGGGLALAGSTLLDPLAAQLAARLGRRSHVPVIVPAVHGDAAAIVGACLLARRLSTSEA